MMNKFMRGRGSGSGAGAIRYLLKERDPMPQVVRGDAALTRELIDSLEFQCKYKSGVLSFSPGETITGEMEQDIMNRFERVAFAGLGADQYNILWVRHLDKARHELHYVVPRVELSTQKSLNIDPPGKASRQLFDDFEEVINREYGLSHPRDLERSQKLVRPDFELKAGADLGEDPRGELHKWVTQKVEQGLIRNRNDIISELKQVGFEIPREGKNYITVRDPESDKRWRLKGEYYSEQFVTKEIERRHAADRGHIESPSGGIEQVKERLERLVQERARYNKERYCKALELEITHTRELNALDNDRSRGRGLGDEQLHLEPERADNGKQVRAERAGRGASEGEVFQAPRDRGEVCSDSAGERLPVSGRGTLGQNVDKGVEHGWTDRVREAVARSVKALRERAERAERAIEQAGRHLAESIRRSSEFFSNIGSALRRSEPQHQQVALQLEQEARQRQRGLGLH